MENRTKQLTALLLALLLMLGASAASAQTAPLVVHDMYDRALTLSEPATRVVALTAADCEILCALGCGDALVGRGAYCDEPAEILGVPVVESGAGTNVEQIIALSPQVVFMGDMAQSVQQVKLLEAAGVQVAVSNADTIQGVYEAIGMIGAIMGRQAQAEALTAAMQAALAAVAAQAENTGKTVYFEVSPLQWGLWTAGSGTFMDEIASLCGLTNAFADVKGWQAVSEEQVLARNPDYIVTITMDSGDGPTPVEEILARPGWDSLRAVAQGNVYQADSDEISRPGPRLKNAAENLLAFIHRETAD